MAPTATQLHRLTGALAARLARGTKGNGPDLERELEEARRRGHWFTEEDHQLVREHEARLAGERRGDLLRRAGRGGAVALLVTATVLPLLWPVAILAGFRAFPSTSRRLALGLVIAGGVSVITAGVLVAQLGRALMAPDGPPPAPAVPALEASGGVWQGGVDADRLGRSLAERIERASDYWTLQGRAADGSATLRRGLYQQRNGVAVMVLPRSTWQLLTPDERRALAAHVQAERGVRAIHVGQIVPSSSFEGSTITVGSQVWP